jgi:DNA excision repair protein ERCC-3
MEKLQTSTLVLTTSTIAVRQWIAELLDKTSLNADKIGEYSGLVKEVKPVTISIGLSQSKKLRYSSASEK